MIALLLAAAVAATPMIANNPTQEQQNQALANAQATQEMALAKGQPAGVLLSSAAAGSDACMVINSLSIGTLIASGNINVSRLDENCVALRQIKALEDTLHLHASAILRACQVPAMRTAIRDAHEGCEDARR